MSLASGWQSASVRRRGIAPGTPLPLLALLPLLAVLALLATGCASTRIDWETRVGRYSYDQAVVELGPPDKVAKLSDSSTVAEWLTGRGMSVGTFYSTGPYYGGYYGRMQTYQSLPAADSFIRLVFGPDGKLTSWKKFTR